MLYYEEYGNTNAELVLFIHGGFTTCKSYMKQYRLLEDYHCVFVDLPNHGKSDYGRKYHFSYDKASDDLIELINRLSPKGKIILVSHSYGGLMTKMLMLKIPEKIEKAIIGSTNMYRTLLFRIYTSKWGCLYLWPQDRKRYKEDNITWRLICDTQKDAWKQFQPFAIDKAVKIPCLLLYAEYDMKIIQKSMLLWKSYLPDSELLMIENAGHNYFYDAAEQVNPIIKSFIENTFNE